MFLGFYDKGQLVMYTFYTYFPCNILIWIKEVGGLCIRKAESQAGRLKILFIFNSFPARLGYTNSEWLLDLTGEIGDRPEWH